jgi:hypothetical protein
VLPALWLDTLQLAIINDNHADISKLLEEIPKLSREDAIEARYLIEATIDEFQIKKISLQETMQKIKKNSAFLAHEKQSSRLYTLS